MSVAGLLEGQADAGREAARGPVTGFSETVGASADFIWKTRTALGATQEYYMPLSQRNDEIKRRFGKNLYELTGVRPDERPDTREKHEARDTLAYEALDKMIQKGRADGDERYVGVKTTEELRENWRQRADMSEKTLQEVLLRNPSPASRFIGEFVGGAGATVADPPNLLSMFIPGLRVAKGVHGFQRARAIMKSAASEGAINAAVEALQQPEIAQWQKTLGRRYGFGDAAENVAMAFAGGTALSGIAKGFVPTIQRGKQAFGSVSHVVLDKVAQAQFLPESVRSAASYLSRVAHIDESAPPRSIRTEADLLEHRQKFERTAEDFESYRRPSEDPAKKAAEAPESLPARAAESAVTRQEVSAEIEQRFLEQAKEIKQALKETASINLDKPATIKKYLGYTPETLSQFIKRAGGIIDEGGELANRGVTSRSLPGLVRKGKKKLESEELLGVGAREISGRSIDGVKEKALEAGYFPEKNTIDEISDTEFYDAIAQDLSGKRVYSEDDLERISILDDASRGLDEYDRLGITEDMTPQEIAAVLRDIEGQVGNTMDIASSGNVPPLERIIDEFQPPESYTAKRAEFDTLLQESPNLKITLEDGTQITAKELAERMGEDLNAIEAMTKCRLG